MSDRDELAELFSSIAYPETPEERDAAEHAIRDMLTPRTITTAEELDTLPDNVLVMTEQGGYWESIKRGDGMNWWKEPGTPGGGYLARSGDLTLPATVLWEPEA